jgi:hypothetical protein
VYGLATGRTRRASRPPLLGGLNRSFYAFDGYVARISVAAARPLRTLYRPLLWPFGVRSVRCPVL